MQREDLLKIADALFVAIHQDNPSLQQIVALTLTSFPRDGVDVYLLTRGMEFFELHADGSARVCTSNLQERFEDLLRFPSAIFFNPTEECSFNSSKSTSHAILAGSFGFSWGAEAKGLLIFVGDLKTLDRSRRRYIRSILQVFPLESIYRALSYDTRTLSRVIASKEAKPSRAIAQAHLTMAGIIDRMLERSHSAVVLAKGEQILFLNREAREGLMGTSRVNHSLDEYVTLYGTKYSDLTVPPLSNIGDDEDLKYKHIQSQDGFLSASISHSATLDDVRMLTFDQVNLNEAEACRAAIRANIGSPPSEFLSHVLQRVQQFCYAVYERRATLLNEGAINNPLRTADDDEPLFAQIALLHYTSPLEGENDGKQIDTGRLTLFPGSLLTSREPMSSCYNEAFPSVNSTLEKGLVRECAKTRTDNYWHKDLEKDDPLWDKRLDGYVIGSKEGAEFNVPLFDKPHGSLVGVLNVQTKTQDIPHEIRSFLVSISRSIRYAEDFEAPLPLGSVLKEWWDDLQNRRELAYRNAWTLPAKKFKREAMDADLSSLHVPSTDDIKALIRGLEVDPSVIDTWDSNPYLGLRVDIKEASAKISETQPPDISQILTAGGKHEEIWRSRSLYEQHVVALRKCYLVSAESDCPNAFDGPLVSSLRLLLERLIEDYVGMTIRRSREQADFRYSLAASATGYIQHDFGRSIGAAQAQLISLPATSNTVSSTLLSINALIEYRDSAQVAVTQPAYRVSTRPYPLEKLRVFLRNTFIQAGVLQTVYEKSDGDPPKVFAVVGIKGKGMIQLMPTLACESALRTLCINYLRNFRHFDSKWKQSFAIKPQIKLVSFTDEGGSGIELTVQCGNPEDQARNFELLKDRLEKAAISWGLSSGINQIMLGALRLNGQAPENFADRTLSDIHRELGRPILKAIVPVQDVFPEALSEYRRKTWGFKLYLPIIPLAVEVDDLINVEAASVLIGDGSIPLDGSRTHRLVTRDVWNALDNKELGSVIRFLRAVGFKEAGRTRIVDSKSKSVWFDDHDERGSRQYEIEVQHDPPQIDIDGFAKGRTGEKMTDGCGQNEILAKGATSHEDKVGVAMYLEAMLSEVIVVDDRIEDLTKRGTRGLVWQTPWEDSWRYQGVTMVKTFNLDMLKRFEEADSLWICVHRGALGVEDLKAVMNSPYKGRIIIHSDNIPGVVGMRSQSYQSLRTVLENSSKYHLMMRLWSTRSLKGDI